MDTIKQHQEMGYDRTVGMFSPDGLLLQVEYAEKAVKLGSSVMALTTKEGIVFIGDRRVKSKLLVKESFRKIIEIDEHLAVCGAGVMSDGRRLIEQAQYTAQDHKVKFQDPIDILSLVKDVANIQQYYSQAGGLRPFGVSLLIGGVENGAAHLYQSMPSGIYLKYKARAAGQLDEKLNEGLEKEYKESLSNKDAVKLALSLFKKELGEEFSPERFDIVEIGLDKTLHRLGEDEVKKLA
ncbi:archaeal proteasome endopeptidase complex subunit alpha [Candidatus Woesearchaeota archaeon]|nr:archaeal proteasome endopeptidase complex subunit alpha [Nanoarchaeota archaeon]MCB9371035.1 archaeal proteasome endopeptidase complex subunit alpha [Candidatus Woesearchaeota archaeon]USN44247.1 MAG: archaeal proteasome endopeptidase complex subunit alpha [Candidatus Woesearchaeota archaeon]